MRNDCIFFSQLRVRYGEVDPQGVVYNGNYAIYADVAFEEFLISKGYSYKELAREHGSEVCHIKSIFDYMASAEESDVLDVGIQIAEVRNKSFTLIFEIYQQGQENLLVRVESVYVGYDKENRTSRELTGLMRKLLTK